MWCFPFSVCGRTIEELDTTIQSPNYPNTPYIAPDQYDENPQCYWDMRPAYSNVSAIWITFQDFLVGRREDWGGCRYISAFKCKHSFVSEFSTLFCYQHCSLFLKFQNIVFHSSLEISGNSNWNVSSNGKCPMSIPRYFFRLAITKFIVKPNKKLQIIV